MTMNKDIKARWIAALRSGEYKQGQEFLRARRYERVDADNCPIYEERFCCLGVLCDLYIKEVDVPEEFVKGYQVGSPYYTYDGHSGVLPDAVQEWAELDSDVGEFRINDDGFSKFQQLTKLNDKGKTFEEIADVIEEYF